MDALINELAFLGRAHNWDKERINPKTLKREEYDDLDGDKPSCYSGVKRRFFQACYGSKVYQSVKFTEEDMDLEIIGYFKDIFCQS